MSKKTITTETLLPGLYKNKDGTITVVTENGTIVGTAKS